MLYSQKMPRSLLHRFRSRTLCFVKCVVTLVWQWRSTFVNRLTMAGTVTINAPLLTVPVSVVSEISSDMS